MQKEHRPQAAQEKTQRLASELVRNYLDKDNPDAETIRENKKTARAGGKYAIKEEFGKRYVQADRKVL